MKRKQSALLALALMLALLAACSNGAPLADIASATPEQARPVHTAGPGPVSVATAAPATTPTSSPRVAPTPFPEDWGLPNGGIGNARVSALDLDRERVSQLQVAWSAPIEGLGPYGGAAGGLVIADGTVFFQDLASTVWAYDLASGELRWRQPGLATTAGPNGPVAVDGRVYAPRGGRELAAFDAASGELLWSVELEKEAFQPFVGAGLVFAGTGVFAHVGGNSGYLHAFDAESGEPRWLFQVVEDGFWGDPALNSGGGVWYPGAVDEELGLVYVGTGNPGPYPGTREYPNGSSRPGDNLYTSSLVALEIGSGELAWHYQAVSHGLFDYDFQLPPILTSIVDGDSFRDIVVAAGKVGRVVALDRANGTVVWETEVGQHLNDDLTELPAGERVEVLPGIFGGAETPMALADGLLFVPVVNSATVHTATGHGALDGSSALLNASANTDLSRATGELVALNVASGAIAWTATFDSPLFGGATAIGDLVVTATFDGSIVALQQSDGVEVWRYDAGGGINSWPAVAADTLVWAVGLGSSPRLLALRLDGANAAND